MIELLTRSAKILWSRVCVTHNNFHYKRDWRNSKKGKDVAVVEVLQLHKRNCVLNLFVLKTSQDPNDDELWRDYIPQKKRTEKIQGWLIYNGKATREYIFCEDKASHTALNKSISLCDAIDAHEGRDSTLLEIHKDFIQKVWENNKDNERVIMKISGVLVD